MGSLITLLKRFFVMLSTARRLCWQHAGLKSQKLGGSSTASAIFHCTLGGNLASQQKTSVPSRKCSVSSEASVLIRESKGVGFVTLNRPKALNALSLDMIRIMTPQLKKWKEEGMVKVVMVRGAGEKAFCAGGDIRAITAVPGGEIQRQFFKEEYQLDHLVGSYPIPYIALLNGITMGGGVGVSVNGKWRIATEKTVFAMPETAIGLIPDVGGGFFLPRLQGQLGMFLGLTGHRLKGWDCFSAGVATHAVKGDDVPKLEEAISELASRNENGALDSQVKQILDEFTPEEAREHNFSLEEHMDMINRVFSADSVEEVVDRLVGEQGDLAKRSLKSLKAASPTSLKVTHRQIREGTKASNLGEVLTMEHRLVTRCCEDSDFYEGVRATLVDRDNKPVWKPGSLAEISKERVESYFSPLPQDRELVL